MLWATAKSVREERSKQRYALQDFSFIRVSLVKGKSGWRIGSVEAVSNPFMKARSRSERAFIKNTVSLLRRYIHGEQRLPEVFVDVEQALSDALMQNDLDTTFSLFSARLLYLLGYISKQGETAALLTAATLTEARQLYTPTQAAELTKIIDEAHRLSHL